MKTLQRQSYRTEGEARAYRQGIADATTALENVRARGEDASAFLGRLLSEIERKTLDAYTRGARFALETARRSH